MKVKWVKVVDIYTYVLATLSLEADDISKQNIDAFPWVLKKIELDKLEVSKALVETHDKEEIHIKRRDDFIIMIQQQKPILPLIALGEKLSLVDGYARYRALKKLGVKNAAVLCQIG